MITTAKRMLLRVAAVGLLALALPLRASTAEAEDYAPSNPHLIEAGRSILNAMKSNEGRRWLTGQMEIHWEEARKDEMSNSVFERTGRYPAIRGWDTPFGNPERDAAWMIDTIIKDWRGHRIVPTISEHLGAPTYGGGFDNIFHQVSIEACLTPGTRENRALMAMLDAMAADLQALEDAGVPVLWRPWHEAGGGFWWSADGPERYKKLWSFTWTYLTRTKELNNLIWVWSTLGRDNKDYAPYYPGDSTVDIVGGSMYNDGRTPAGNWPVLDAIAPSKLKAITEAGDTMWAYDSDLPYVYFLVWTTKKDTAAVLPSIYRAPSAVTRSDVAAYINGTPKPASDGAQGAKAIGGSAPPPADVGVGAPPPAGAEVLIDGSRALLDEKWTYWEGPRFSSALPIKWKIVDDPDESRTAASGQAPGEPRRSPPARAHR